MPSLFCCFREEHQYDTDAQRCQARNTRVRRSKGSQGNITVRWSLYHNDSTDISDLIWPSSGTLSMTDGQWSSSLTLNVASNIKKVPGNIIWIKLAETTGGALLASEDETVIKIILTSNLSEKNSKWFIFAILVPIASILFYWRYRQ